MEVPNCSTPVSYTHLGGGQPSDLGILGDTAVTDVQEKNGELIHYVKSELEPGTEVIGKIDWQRRFDLMQQHSGEHIVDVYKRQGQRYHNHKEYCCNRAGIAEVTLLEALCINVIYKCFGRIFRASLSHDIRLGKQLHCLDHCDHNNIFYSSCILPFPD